MKRIEIIFILAGLVLISSCVSQRGAYRDMGRMKTELFYADPDVYYNQDSNKSETVIYVDLPVENLLYKINYKNNLYESPVTVTINIVSPDDSDVVRKVYNELSSFTEKELKNKMKQSLYFVYKYFIPSGKYKATIKIKDENSENEFTKKYDLTVKDFLSKDVSSSDLLVLKKYSVNSDGTKEITPLIRDNLSGLKNFFIYYEIYNNTNEDITKQFLLKMSDNNGKTLVQDTLSYILKPGRNREIGSLELPEFNLPLPGKDDPGFSNERDTSFLIELIDKSANQTIADKKLIRTLPDRHPAMQHHSR